LQSLTFASTVSVKGCAELSEQLHGGVGFHDVLLADHGQPLRDPQNPNHRPEGLFLAWHQKQVFQGPARYLETATD